MIGNPPSSIAHLEEIGGSQDRTADEPQRYEAERGHQTHGSLISFVLFVVTSTVPARLRPGGTLPREQGGEPGAPAWRWPLFPEIKVHFRHSVIAVDRVPSHPSRFGRTLARAQRDGAPDRNRTGGTCCTTPSFQLLSRSRDAKTVHGTSGVIVDQLESCRIRLRSRTATTATSSHDDRLNEPSEYPGKQKAKPDWLRFAAIVGSLSGLLSGRHNRVINQVSKASPLARELALIHVGCLAPLA